MGRKNGGSDNYLRSSDETLFIDSISWRKKIGGHLQITEGILGNTKEILSIEVESGVFWDFHYGWLICDHVKYFWRLSNAFYPK